MAPIGTYWGFNRQPPTKVILTVAALNDLELEQPEFSFTNKPAEFMNKFPYGKIPAFETTDGFKLIEGATIARYLCGVGTKVNLLGSNPKESILVDQWTHFAESEIGNPNYAMMGIIYGMGGPFNREALDKQKERLVRALNYLETHLKTCTSGYLISDSVTLADYFIAAMVAGACHAAIGADERAQYPAIFAHYAKVTENEKIKQLWGTEGFTEVAVTEPMPVPQT